MNRLPSARTAVWLAAAATAVSPLLLPVSAAQATTDSVRADFNGDGYRDLAVGAPYATVSGKTYAGAVVVLYGSSSGLSATRRTVVTQDSAGIPGTAEEGDEFGSSVTSADLDGDGRTDLVVGAPDESVGTRGGLGSVTVVWGGSGGLSASGATLSAPAFREYASFGENIAAGDVDGDGATDLSVAARDGLTQYQGPFTRTGAPAHREVDPHFGGADNVISGDLTGDGSPERIVLPGMVDGDPTRTELPGADGITGAVGDINGDGYGDLILGAPYDPQEHGETGHLGGQISVWYGGPTGPDISVKPRIINQSTTNVPGASEAEDGFGTSVSVGDLNGDGRADIAVGAPGEDLSGKRDAGSVTVLYGTASGLTTAGSTAYTQDTAGVPGTAETYDRFGETTQLVDLNRNGRADLSVGAPSENSYGMLTTLPGTASGVSTSGAVTMTARTVGLSGQSLFSGVLGR